MVRGVPVLARRTYLAELRATAVALMEEQAAKEPRLEHVPPLDALARQVTLVSPHQLRHGLAYRLWKTATPEAIREILSHSRVATTLKYGKPTEDDLRAALADASRMRYGEGVRLPHPRTQFGISRGERESNGVFRTLPCRGSGDATNRIRILHRSTPGAWPRPDGSGHAREELLWHFSAWTTWASWSNPSMPPSRFSSNWA
jgi:hypothetical protein